MEKIPHPSEYFDYLALRAIITLVAIILLGFFVSTVVIEAKKDECVVALAVNKYPIEEIIKVCGVEADG